MTQVDTGRIRARTRVLSKSLLGAQFRAEIAALIGMGRSPFWARGLSEQLGIPENKIAAELTRFANNGLLTAMPMEAWDRRRLYQPNPASGHYWDSARQLVEQAAKEEGARVGVPAEAAMSAYRLEVLREHDTRVGGQR